MSRKDKEKYREYMRVYMNKRYHKRREEIISSLGRKCWLCGSTDSLEIDHIDPNTKSFNIGERLSWAPMKVINEEVAKCQLLCQPCHARKTIDDAGQLVMDEHHGTANRYTHGGCRCRICKDGQASRMREYRKINGR